MTFTVLEDEVSDHNGQARFTVFGVGGGGGNAVQNMVEQQISGVKFVCANTDKQALDRMAAPNKIQLGEQSTRGLGAGAKPEIGRAAAEETRDAIRQHLEGTDMVFVTAGMGGGTGTGAAPVVAEIAKEMGILTVGVVTTPFKFEQRKRAKAAEQGLEELEKHVDSLIIIPNQRLREVFGEISIDDAFKKADDVLLGAVRSIFDLVVNPGRINLDFADLKTAMSTRGYAMMGAGVGRGEKRAEQAAEMAIRSPLLDDVNIKNAKGVLLNITGGKDMTLSEAETIAELVGQIIDEEQVEFFYGTVTDPDITDEIRVTVVATGLTRNAAGQVAAAATPRSATATQTAQAQPEDADDIPAIQRAQQSAAEPVKSNSAAHPTPMSIQDYLKNQQRK